MLPRVHPLAKGQSDPLTSLNSTPALTALDFDGSAAYLPKASVLNHKDDLPAEGLEVDV